MRSYCSTDKLKWGNGIESGLISGFTGCYITSNKITHICQCQHWLHLWENLQVTASTLLRYYGRCLLQCLLLNDNLWGLSISFSCFVLWCTVLPQNFCLWCRRRERSQKSLQTQPWDFCVWHFSFGERRCTLHFGGTTGRGCMSRSK